MPGVHKGPRGRLTYEATHPGAKLERKEHEEDASDTNAGEEAQQLNRTVMATAAKIPTYAHITRSPKVCGGKACIDNTRIRVMDIVELEREGKRCEVMLNVFAVPLTFAQVYAALSYYYDHADEIDADFKEGARVEAQIDRDRAEYFKRQAGQ